MLNWRTLSAASSLVVVPSHNPRPGRWSHNFSFYTPHYTPQCSSAAETAEKPGKFGQFGQVLIFIFILHMLIYPQYTQAPDAALFCLNYFSFRRKYQESTGRQHANDDFTSHRVLRVERWRDIFYGDIRGLDLLFALCC